MMKDKQSGSDRHGIIRPKDIVSPEDYFNYTQQRLGDRVPTMPTVRVPHASLFDVMRLVLDLLDADKKAYEDLQIFEIEGGDHIFTSHFESPSAGDRASAFFSANATSADQKAFAQAYANAVAKLHRIHQGWTAAGQPIRPLPHGV